MGDRHFRILSLSGGGARGVFQAAFLNKLQSELKTDVRDGFDLIAGSSTGTITGLAVAFGIPLSQVLALYDKKAKAIFQPRFLSGIRRGTKYSQHRLRTSLEQVFGDKTLQDCGLQLLFTATATDRFEHRLFSNIASTSTDDGAISAVEVALASSAAPTYFPPVRISAGTRTYIDGGLWANSPLLVAILTAHMQLNVPFSEMRVLSIGTGTFPGGKSHEQLARLRPLSIDTVRTVLDSISAAQSSFAERYAEDLLDPGNCIHITAPLQKNIPLDDVKRSLEILPPLAEREAANKAPLIRKQFFELSSLTAPHFGPRYQANHALIYRMLPAAGLTAFYPSRQYYHLFREASSIDTYVATARNSVVMVSINLMTGVPYNDLCQALRTKLIDQSSFTATISLIDPAKSELMESLAPVLDMAPKDLAERITESLQRLMKLKRDLPEAARSRLSIRVHRAIPLGSAILLDHETPEGRIQIETKVYKAPFDRSFAFEINPTGTSDFYRTIVKGYSDLMSDGAEYA